MLTIRKDKVSQLQEKGKLIRHFTGPGNGLERCRIAARRNCGFVVGDDARKTFYRRQGKAISCTTTPGASSTPLLLGLGLAPQEGIQILFFNVVGLGCILLKQLPLTGYLALSRWRWWSPCCRCGFAQRIRTQRAAPGAVWGSGALSAVAPSCLKPSCLALPASVKKRTTILAGPKHLLQL